MQRTLKFKIDGEEIVLGTSPYFFDSIEGLSSSENEIESYTTINKDGSHITGSNLSDRLVIVEGRIRGTDRQSAFHHRRRLISLLNSKRGLGILEVEYSDGSKYYTEAIVDGGVSIRESNLSETPANIFNFTVQFLCPNVYWKQEEVYITNFTKVIPAFEFEIDIDMEDDDDMKFGEVQHSPFGRIVNKGDCPSGFTCIVEEELTDYFCLTNINTGEFIKINKPLQRGEKLFIYSHIGNKKIIHQDTQGRKTNWFKYMDLDSTFFLLRPGNNDLKFTTNNEMDTVNVIIEHNNLYAGI